MKTLLLASSGSFVIEQGFKILHKYKAFLKPLDQIKIAYVTTASDGVDDKSYIDRHKQKMLDLGYNFEEIDIEGKDEKELYEVLKNKDAVYVDGGNTFYLLKYVRESGFDKVIKDLVENGIVYIGSSAGAYIVCPTIEMSRWELPGKKIKDNYGVIDLSALNLVPFIVKAHYRPEWKNVLKKYIENTKYPVKILTNDQALLVRNSKIKLVGKGKEIRI
ncbi:peptidase E [Patescibacteria group bacterium AH-259-L05]|nr:peptidase E [Patescibacteria group bacterium AH-259-L05]